MKRAIYVISVLLAATSFIQYRINIALRAEKNRQTANVSALLKDIQHYKVNDSLNAISVEALQLNVSELKTYRAADAELIKSLRLRPKDVEYITKTKIVTRDSLIYVLRSDSCFYYRDDWLTVDARLKDSTMFIESRDSITQIIAPVYKHRFLLWRWGLKGIRQNVLNHNPRSKIQYSEIIKIQK